MSVELIRVYNNGVYIVAEFREDFSRTFAINEKNLETRIANRKKYGLDASVELAALSAIRSHEDYQQAKETPAEC